MTTSVNIPWHRTATAGRVVKFLERFLRPRLTFLNERRFYRGLAGVLIALSGLFLVLPLPIPFSNGLLAWSVVLLAAAALQRDGLCFLAGCALFVVTATFFVLLALGGAEALDHLRRASTGHSR